MWLLYQKNVTVTRQQHVTVTILTTLQNVTVCFQRSLVHVCNMLQKHTATCYRHFLIKCYKQWQDVTPCSHTLLPNRRVTCYILTIVTSCYKVSHNEIYCK